MEATILRNRRKTIESQLQWFCDKALSSDVRTLREFAEQEIVVPTGPFEGQRYRAHRQPSAVHFFAATENPQYNRFFGVGPTQSGKSLSFFVIPVLYHIFEMAETTIIGVPTEDMAVVKWKKDIRPIIESTRFAKYLPTEGRGSKGGFSFHIEFGNGADVLFLTGGGGDKARAGYTSRVECITEVDHFDVVGGTSRETNKFKQLEGRLRAFRNKLVYAECTASIPNGIIWQEFLWGTRSQIALKCPHCEQWTVPLEVEEREGQVIGFRDLFRESLIGWREAETELEAYKKTKFSCPQCAALWNEFERTNANSQSLLLHRGQEVVGNDEVVGPKPETQTFSIRWNAVNNQFADPREIGKEEWLGEKSESDEEETALSQFTWALPYIASQEDLETNLTVTYVRSHQGPHDEYIIPDDTVYRITGMDIGKRAGHYVCLAVTADATVYVTRYGVAEMYSDEMGVRRGVLKGLRDFWEWHYKKFKPDHMWIDSRGTDKKDNWQDSVFQFCRETAPITKPCQGEGMENRVKRVYAAPKGVTKSVIFLGKEYHIEKREAKGVFLVVIGSDYWKEQIVQRFSMQVGSPTSVNLYKAERKTHHQSFAKHVLAERREKVFVAGKGYQVKFIQVNPNNHYLDALMLGLGATDFAFRKPAVPKLHEGPLEVETAIKINPPVSTYPVVRAEI